MAEYSVIGKEIGKLVQTKNKAYGDSFHQTGKVLAILYPNGVMVEQFDDLLAVTRVIDKLFRVATDKNAFNESPWKDIAGYAILALKREHGKTTKT